MFQTFIFSIFGILLMTSSTLAAGTLPAFKDYPAGPLYQGQNAAPDLSTDEANTFKTRLKKAAKEKPNFAGHYILTQWGCGAGCINFAIINAKTGKVRFPPFTLCCWPPNVDDPIEFRPDSKLIVLNGQINEGGQDKDGKFYYQWEGDQFKFLQFSPRK